MLHYMFLFFWTQFSAPALADDWQQAEYVRLSDEIHMLAKRQSWSGVERLYRACKNLDVEINADEHLLAAHSAQASGDIKRTRERLLLVAQAREDRSAMDWLWSIDTQYKEVHLVTDSGQTLQSLQVSLHPIASQAMKFAQEQILTNGLFSGYLPVGEYQLGHTSFHINEGYGKLRVDTRADSGMPLAHK
jgi:hypothetical protein